MGLAINLIFCGIAFLTFAISAGFLTDSVRRIGQIPNYSANNHLKNAHYVGTIDAIVSWIVVALLLLAIVLYIIYGSETAEYTGSIFLYFVLLISLGGALTTGIIGAYIAYNINQSGVSDNNGSYKQAIVATVLALITFTLLVILFLIKVFYKPKKKEKSGENPDWFLSEIENDPELAAEAI